MLQLVLFCVNLLVHFDPYHKQTIDTSLLLPHDNHYDFQDLLLR